MARTKSQDVMVEALGRRRSQLNAEIKAVDLDSLAAKKAELAEVEAALKDIDPEIKSLAEEEAESASALARQESAKEVKK